MHSDRTIAHSVWTIRTNWYRFRSWFFGPQTWKVRSRKAFQGRFQTSHSVKKWKELASHHPTGSWLDRTRLLGPLCFPQSVSDSVSHWEQDFFELSIPILFPRCLWRPRTPKPFEVGRELTNLQAWKGSLPHPPECWHQIRFGDKFIFDWIKVSRSGNSNREDRSGSKSDARTFGQIKGLVCANSWPPLDLFIPQKFYWAYMLSRIWYQVWGM